MKGQKLSLYSPRYTEHSTVGLAQQWDQLNQLGMRIRHNLEQQIQARNQSGVSEDALKEFSMMFRHFDKEKTGRLDLQAFKSCLRALGYDLPMVEEGEPEPEFEQILVVVDPNKDGFVTLQDYMAFMISKETENVQSSEEIENAFRAITAQEREYVTQEELYSNLSKEMADYCIARMKPYVDPRTGQGITGMFMIVSYPHVKFLLLRIKLTFSLQEPSTTWSSLEPSSLSSMAPIHKHISTLCSSLFIDFCPIFPLH